MIHINYVIQEMLAIKNSHLATKDIIILKKCPLRPISRSTSKLQAVYIFIIRNWLSKSLIILRVGGRNNLGCLDSGDRSDKTIHYAVTMFFLHCRHCIISRINHKINKYFRILIRHLTSEIDFLYIFKYIIWRQFWCTRRKPN